MNPGTNEPARAAARTGPPEARVSDIHGRTTTLSALADSGHGALGPFRLKRVILAADSTVLFEAVQEHPRRVVGLKVLGPGPVGDDARRRFETEAAILATLQHPGIARLYEAGSVRAPFDGSESDAPYIALEYFPGARTLLDHTRQRALSLPKKLELFAELCDAVQHANRHGIVHRRLRPETILIDGEGRVRLFDAGVTRALDSDAAPPADPGDPDPDRFLGTIRYMSPEQARGDPGEMDYRSDVYALGVLLYELLTGQPPYDLSQAPVVRAAEAIARLPARRPSEIDPSLAGDAESIVLKALQKNRDRRYPSAGDLGADIRRFLAGEPLSARDGNPLYVMRTLAAHGVARHPLAGTLLALAAGVLVGIWPGPRLVFTWTPLGAWFERAASTMVAPSSSPPLSEVRVVALDDALDTEALAAAVGVSGVSARPGETWTTRALYARLMQRLAPSGVRALVFDLYFATDRPVDEAFAGGVQALRAADVPVIIGIWPWALAPDSHPLIAPRILESGVRWGGATMSADERAPWKLDAIMWREEHEPQPSFVLEAVAAQRYPAAEPLYRVDHLQGHVEVRYRLPRPGVARAREIARERIALAGIDRVQEDKPEDGLREGDGYGAVVLPMPARETLQAATLSFDAVLRATDEQLAAWFKGRTILVADLRNKDDVSRHPDGRTIPRAYGHAVAIDAILKNLVIRLPRPLHEGGLTIGAALVGAVIPWRIRHRPVRVMLYATVAAAALAASVAALGYAHYLCNPLVPLLSLTVAALVAEGVVRAREGRAARAVQGASR